MATNIPTMSVAERTHSQSIVFKSLAKSIAAKLRCGLPGIITKFDPVKQYVSVHLAIQENVINMTGGGYTPTDFPELADVLLLLPGDANYCLTFPNIVGSECYVCFADMCVNAWATHGMAKDSKGHWLARKQELARRHDLSDGFAILAPRSNHNAIPNYSTSNVELRSMDGTAKIALTNTGTVLLKGTGLEIDGTGGIITKPGNTPSTACIQVTINGVVWYVRLSTAP